MPLTSTSRLSGGGTMTAATRRPSFAAGSALGGARGHRARRPQTTVALLRVGGGGGSGGASSPAAPPVTWDQSADEVFVRVPLSADVRGRDVDLEVHPTRVSLRVQGEPVLEGPVEGAGAGGAAGGEPAIDVDGCFFTVEDDAAHGRHVLLTLAKRTPGYLSWPELLETDRADDTVTRRCWLDVAIRADNGAGGAAAAAAAAAAAGGGEEQEEEPGAAAAGDGDDDDADGGVSNKKRGKAARPATTTERRGRVVLGLYGNAAPRAVANFVALCEGGRREDGLAPAAAAAATSRDALHFLGTPFHRVIPGFMAQGGDTTFGDGTGGASIHGDAFDDEAQGLRLPHDRRGVLAMANAGADTNSSQFYLTFRAAPHLDGKHVVFGRVERGGDVLAALEAIGTPGGRPRGRAAVVGCGALPEGAGEEAAAELAAQMPLGEVDNDGDEGVSGKGGALAWVWEQPFLGEEGEEDGGDGAAAAAAAA